MDCITNIFVLIIGPILISVFNMINRREEPEPEITEPETELETEIKQCINKYMHEKDKNV